MRRVSRGNEGIGEEESLQRERGHRQGGESAEETGEEESLQRKHGNR
jgi:hypothetical protein